MIFPPPPPLSEDWVLDREYLKLSVFRPVGMAFHEVAGAFRRHSHSFTELVLMFDGVTPHVTFDEAGQRRVGELHRGDFLVIPPGIEHEYPPEAAGYSCHRVDICYLPEWFLWDLNLLWTEGLVPLFFASHLFRRPEQLHMWSFQLNPTEVEACQRELAEIEAEYKEERPSLLFIRSTFFRLLVRLARAWRRQTPQGDLHFRPEIWQAMQTIDSLIKEGQILRIETVAHDTGMTPKTFSRLFSQATGLAPSEYFGRRRTQHAAHLLLETEYSVGEIAARLGFCDSAHLSRAFLQNEGVSPREFRRRYRGEERRFERMERAI